MAKTRKLEGRRLAARSAVRQRLRVQQAQFEDRAPYRSTNQAKAAARQPAVRTELDRRLAPIVQTARLDRRQTEALERLVRTTDRSKLVDAQTRVRDNLPPGLANTYLGGLAQLAKAYRRWIREPEDWKRRTHNRDRQFTSLARHLLVEYPVPAFLDEAWFSAEADHQQWFIRIGRGHNIRHERSLPVPMSKRMVHEFLNAPTGLGISQAIRWAQAVTLGMNARNAWALAGTRLGRSFEHEAFWSTVVRFLAGQTLLDPRHYGPVVDYLHNQRFVAPPPAIVDGQRVEFAPPQPNLSMKGRKPETLLRSVSEWHRQLARATFQRRVEAELALSWESSGIPGFVQTEGAAGERQWLIAELRSATELVNEGREMGHCIATYVGSCASRQHAIFSMVFVEKRRSERRLTIDVELATRRIIETAGRFNRPATEQEHRVLSSWATKAGLTVSEWA